MTEPGQTDTYSLSDHVKAIHDHAGKGIVEYCIYDTGELIPEYIRKYNMQGQELVEIDSSKTKAEGVNLMQREISHIEGEYIRHNPDAIAASIIQLICDDLKFRDMQNDTKYVLLNDRLKEAKKNLKENSKNESFRQPKRKAQKDESKFFQKYKERIEAIQEAEIKTMVKEGIPIEEIKEKKAKKAITKKTQAIVNKATTTTKKTTSNKKGKKETKPKLTREEIQTLEEIQKKEFIEAINNLRKDELKDKKPQKQETKGKQTSKAKTKSKK